MDNSVVQLVGTPCGQHGPYTFYKAFKYAKNGLKRIVKISEFFFVKLWSDSDLVCIGELQLLWVDKNSDQVLSSLRLYFLPENTPEGRMDHGEDEVLAISEKVVLRLEDLITWITVDAEWSWGRLGKYETDVKEPKEEIDSDLNVNTTESSLDFSDVEKERLTADEKSSKGPSVIILSYSSYCRYRAMMKRLEGVEDEYLKHRIVKILGGFCVPSKNTRILFCRDTFDYPELEGHELLCNHLAPKLKGRPRGRRKKRSISPGSESNESECSISNVFNSNKTKLMTEGPNGFRSDISSPRRSTRSLTGNNENKEFLKKLTTFMKSIHTPIGRIPSLGYRELDLHAFFIKVDKLGGYDAVTTNRLWKSIFDDLSANYISTSAATVIRRHYERFLLPYERHLKGEEYKVPSSKRTKSHSGSGSDIDTGESTSGSGKSTPVPQLTVIALPPSTDTKDTCLSDKAENGKPEIKPSSLRSVRVKSERLKENVSKDKAAIVEKSDNVGKITNEYSIEVKADLKTSPQRNISDNNLINNGLTVELISTALPTLPNSLSNTHESSNEFSKPTSGDSNHTSIEKITSTHTNSSSKALADKTKASVEGKENVATCKNSSISKKNRDTNVDLVDVPYKSKSPENVHVDCESSNSGTLANSLLHTVKKRKLDILKEGGLEVTPVKSTPNETKEIKENRPSVIHHPLGIPKSSVGQLSITLTTDKSSIPNNSNSMELSQKAAVPQTNDVQSMPSVSSLQTNLKSVNKNIVENSSFLYLNGQSPPKVVQSKSIYSYSEKTVYGNPKEYFTPMPHPPPPQAPKFIESPHKKSGTEILDLTFKSPQKPVVEIMRVPSVASRTPSEAVSKHLYKHFPQIPVLDSRVGSNLEITLVGPNSAASHPIQQMNQTAQKYNSSTVTHNHSATHGSTMLSNSSHKNYVYNNKIAHKRTFSGSIVAQKKEENGRVPMCPGQQSFVRSEQRHQNNAEFTPPNSYSGRNSITKLENSKAHTKTHSQSQAHLPNVKSHAATPSILPNYLTQFSMASKMMPHYVPSIDPLYYSALQTLYPHNPLSSVQPFFPVPTPDQLQFYTDLMTRNTQMGFPFPYSQDGNASVTTGNTETNNFKKQ